MTTTAPAAGKKAAARKTTAPKAVDGAAEVSAEKPAAPVRKKAPRKTVAAYVIQPEERHHLVEVAAYYIAERRGFHGASSHDDWLQAEREVDAMIAAGQFTA